MKVQLAAVALCVASLSAHAADLSVSLQGVSSQQGRLMVALYASEDAYKKKEPLQARALPANGVRDTVFKDLAPGRYAIAVFHDENGNGKLDRDGAGLPLEAYGFSRNPGTRYGPPGFADAAVSLDKESQALSITLE